LDYNPDRLSFRLSKSSLAFTAKKGEKMSETTIVPFTPAVPTTTLIISKDEQPEMVIVFDSNGKHGNKKVLPGGRVKVGYHDWLTTGMVEAKEEVGITDLKNIRLFTTCSQVGRYVRKVSLEKYLDGAPVPSGIDLKEIEIHAHYGFDLVLMATTKSEPVPDNDETKNAYFVNVHEVNPDEFALDHGHLLVAFSEYLRSGKLPELGRF
jgi:ADP-ribose pyrophosphatase YjhB (NUDIX family)